MSALKVGANSMEHLSNNFSDMVGAYSRIYGIFTRTFINLTNQQRHSSKDI